MQEKANTQTNNKNTGIIVSIFTESQMHVGMGRSETFVDLPVTREQTTYYPYIPGTGLKGSLKSGYKQIKRITDDNEKIKKYFGHMDSGAGSIVISDAKLLLLPIRSLTTNYLWVTCPYILERLNRDFEFLGISTRLPEIAVDREKYVGPNLDKIFLEEREFDYQSSKDHEEIVRILSFFIPHEQTSKRLANQLIILNDNDFKWFAQYGLVIQARNVLNPETKSSENIWYEEWISQDTLFYSMVFPRNPTSSDNGWSTILNELDYVQIGGNETVGHGICKLTNVTIISST